MEAVRPLFTSVVLVFPIVVPVFSIVVLGKTGTTLVFAGKARLV